MNLITKLLMENEVKISGYINAFGTRNQTHGLEIRIINIKDIPSKKELLEEVSEKIYVSALEWELLNYWKEIGVEKIYKNKSNENVVLCGLKDQYLQPSSMYSIFKFLKHGEMYIINDLIERCALIEG